MAPLKGHISQIIGPVVDVHFDLSDDSHGQLPAIHEALTILREDSRGLLVEVQQHIGEDTVRTPIFANYFTIFICGDGT